MDRLERDDGANVHGCTGSRRTAEWSRLFSSGSWWAFDETTTMEKASRKSVESGLVSPVKVTGEAYLNQRKGKIIAGYELEISVEYECEERK